VPRGLGVPEAVRAPAAPAVVRGSAAPAVVRGLDVAAARGSRAASASPDGAAGCAGRLSLRRCGRVWGSPPMTPGGGLSLMWET
jgi:hypothetical protein